MKRHRLVALLACALAWVTSLASAAPEAPATPVTGPDTTWFQTDGFGIFLHWGPYSAAAGRWNGQERTKDIWGEWMRQRAGISPTDYEMLARRFTPQAFVPTDWAEVFKKSGARYVVLTAKHHDGFALFKSAASPFNIIDSSPAYGRDLVRELGDAVRVQGLRYGVYYSQQVDWHHAATAAEFPKYFNSICLPQVTELLERYGPLAVLWFDIGLKNPAYAHQLKDLVRARQPAALISARLGAGVPGDYSGGGDNEVPPTVKAGPWESCMTLTHHWSYYPQDTYRRSASEVIRLLAEIRAKGGNLLLNIGPDGDGRLLPADVAVLRQVGAWLEVFGASIYGVNASPIAPVPWGWVTLGREQILYLHVLDFPETGEIVLPGVIGPVHEAWLLGDPARTPLTVLPSGDRDHRILMPVATAPTRALDSSDTVIAVRLSPDTRFDLLPLLQPDWPNLFTPAAAQAYHGAKIKNERIVYTSEEDPAVEKARYDAVAYLSGDARLDWRFRSTADGDYHLVLDYAEPSSTPRTLEVTLDGQTFFAPLTTTPESKLHRFATLRLGTAALRAHGDHTLSLRLAPSTGTSSAEAAPVVFNRLRLLPTRTSPLPGSLVRFPSATANR